MERLIGGALFERRASGSYLTPIGKILYARSRSFFEIVETAIEVLCPSQFTGNPAIIAQRLTRAQARTLSAVMDTGSFPSAAEKMGLSLVSLQRAARDLDSNVYGSIFYRSADGMMVTPQGLEFGRQLQLATQEIEWAIREIDASRGRAKGLVTIGALPFGGSLLLANSLDEFICSHPNVEVRIVTEGATEMISRLRGGKVDMVLGLIQEISGNDLGYEVLAETPYRIVTRAGHPLAKRAKVEIDDLVEWDWIIGTEGSNRRQYFEKLFEGRQSPSASIATSALAIIRRLLMCSDRIALITDYELTYEGTAFATLAIDPFDTSPAIGVTLRKNWRPTHALVDFIQLLKRNVTEPANHDIGEGTGKTV